MPRSSTLHDWFHYSDRNNSPYNPTADLLITTEMLLDIEIGSFDDADWKEETWLVHSALVPIDQLNDSLKKIDTAHLLSFELGWNFEDKFSFGRHKRLREIDLYPLITPIKHPTSKQLRIELNRDFILYHAVEERGNGLYYHPTDNILVAEIKIETHKFFEPTAKARIHRDYLRDFLAATNTGLLLSVIADRFANSSEEEELQIENEEKTLFEDGTFIWTSIHPPKFSGHSYYRGRSTIYRNFNVRPYEKPKFQRNPWYFFGEEVLRDGTYPEFIVNDEGTRKMLPRNTLLETYISEGIGTFGYLYFRPEVLQKYLKTANHSVFFHMRNWGIVSLPKENTIDVGINSHGLVNAFAPDISDLTPEEQGYWASFSSLPSGEICEEMFKTRMLLTPPHSPGIVDLVENARERLRTAIMNMFSIELFNDLKPSKRNLGFLSVGPLTSEHTEMVDLAKLLYEWIIETIEIDPLRSVIGQLGGVWNKDFKQIKLLETILVLKKITEQEARKITNPLRGLNELRIVSAHISGPEVQTSFQLFGATEVPSSSRKGWFLCIDSVVNSINTISDVLSG